MRLLGIDVLVALFVLLAASLARGQDDSSDALWKYYPPMHAAASNANSAHRDNRPSQYQNEPRDYAPMPEPSAESERSLYGYAGDDPLFDRESRPSWTPPTYEKPMFDRPNYSYPSTDVPLYRMEPARAPVVQKPAYVKPNDDKPNNFIENYEGPAYLRRRRMHL